MYLPKEMISGRYLVLAPAIRGGTSCIYKVFDTEEHHIAALRRTGFSFFKSAGISPENYMNMIETIAKLPTANLPSVYSVYAEEGAVWEAMEFAEGFTLEELIKRRPGRPFPLAAVFAVMRELAEAAEALHTAGILHLDIKPGNVLAAEDGRILLIDFGSCRLLSEPLSDRGMPATPPFAAPELYGGYGHLSPRTDIYAAGMTAKAMLGLKKDCFFRPYLRKTYGREEERRAYSLLRIVRACTEVNPEKRPEDCRMLLSMLSAAEQADEKHRPAKALKRAAALVPVLAAAAVFSSGLSAGAGTEAVPDAYCAAETGERFDNPAAQSLAPAGTDGGYYIGMSAAADIYENCADYAAAGIPEEELLARLDKAAKTASEHEREESLTAALSTAENMVRAVYAWQKGQKR